MPTATVDWSAPVPVAMTLEDGKAAVMRWIASADAPRIEWAGYVRGDLVAEQADGEESSAYSGRPWQYRWEWNNDTRTVPSGPVVAVLASMGRLDAPLATLASSIHYDGLCCDDYDDTVRYEAFWIFDAETSEKVVAGRSADWIRKMLTATSVRVRTTHSTQPAPPSTTSPRPMRERGPTSWPMPTIAAPPLSADTVPAAMRPALSAYPLLPGSRWTWRTTSADNGARWHSNRMTETVHAAWLLDEQRVAVLVKRETTAISGSHAPNADSISRDDVWRLVTASGGVCRYPEDGQDCGLADDVSRTIGLPVDALALFGSNGNQVPHSAAPQPVAVSVPAGTFSDCRLVSATGGLMDGSILAICRGVGYVERDYSFRANSPPFDGGRWVAQLESYDVVLPR